MLHVPHVLVHGGIDARLVNLLFGFQRVFIGLRRDPIRRMRKLPDTGLRPVDYLSVNSADVSQPLGARRHRVERTKADTQVIVLRNLWHDSPTS
jgi:hypothetical protein